MRLRLGRIRPHHRRFIEYSGAMNTDGVDDDLPFGLVVNPFSALGRGKRAAVRTARALAARGVRVVPISGRDAAHCREQLRAATGTGLRGLVLVGGDGILGLVLQVPEARRLPLGIVPAGSGNDFARQFGLPHDPVAAVARILAAESAPRAVDLGVVLLPDPERPGQKREHWFAGGLSVGFDAAVNRRANAIRLPLGPFRYHLALIVEVLAIAPRAFSVRWSRSADAGQDPAGRRAFTGLLATVMNIRAIGGGIPLTPQAEPDDGALDLLMVDACSTVRLLSVLGVLARGRHARLPEVRMERAERVGIEAGSEIAYADGEPVGVGPFEVSVAPGALRLLA
ncbi:diacylglycerol kinase [Leucobacter iarius]|uniref:Diacylglycerol kinase n=2 Tax=Leucobacter iarius TaxID=333963 RepID=A0ABN2LTW6_9MICO